MATTLIYQQSRIIGNGEICLACNRPIWGQGERISCSTMTTHAHWTCLTLALRLLEFA